jgi:hypothetical protein
VAGTGANGGAATVATTGLETGSGGAAGAVSQLVEPEGLQLHRLPGGGDTVNLVAFTLVAGANGVEVYGKVEKAGEDSGCDPNITVEFFNEADQALGSWLGALYVSRLFQRADRPSTIIACLEPGQSGMFGSTDVPPSIVFDEVAYAVYRFSYFARDILPFELLEIEGLTVAQVQASAVAGGNVFTGTVDNGFDWVLTNPGLTIFPTTLDGRPVGIATDTGPTELAPGERWNFETTSVSDAGDDYAAYLSGSLAAP